MTRNRRAKQHTRQHAEQTGGKYTAALRDLAAGNLPRLHLPLPDPITDQPCPACAGTRVTGDLYQAPSDPGRPILLVDALCPTCGGCGRAEHVGCLPSEHADPDEFGDSATLDDDFDDFDEGDPDADGYCHSCRGRRWWACWAFPPDGGPDAEGMHLRMPCGCSEPLLVAV